MHIDEMLNILIDFENRENIFTKKISDVYFYKLIRAGLYNKLLNKLFGTKIGQDKTNNKNIAFNFFISFIPNLFRRNKEAEILLFDGGRAFLDENNNKSIYLFDIIDKLKKENIKFRIVYPWVTPNKIRFFEEPPTFKYFFKYFFLTIKFKLSKKFNFNNLNIEEINLINKYNRELAYLLKTDSNFNFFDCNEIVREIEKFKLQYNYYYMYFKRRKIKKIYMICAYGKEGIVAAAQDLNIKVIEIQHGSITKYHLAYNFPSNQYIPYYPNIFYTFGRYWEETLIFPTNVKLVTYGFPYLKKQLSKYTNILSIKNQILFISQGHIGLKLLEKAINFALKNPKLEIIYRLHPGELRYSIIEYKNILKKYNLKNFNFEECKKDLYQLIKESEYIFAVSSTVIYEALALKKNVGVIGLPSYEEVQGLIEQKYVDFYSEDSIEEIKNIEFKNLEIKKFFNTDMEEKNVE